MLLSNSEISIWLFFFSPKWENFIANIRSQCNFKVIVYFESSFLWIRSQLALKHRHFSFKLRPNCLNWFDYLLNVCTVLLCSAVLRCAVLCSALLPNRKIHFTSKFRCATESLSFCFIESHKVSVARGGLCASHGSFGEMAINHGPDNSSV